MAVQSRPRFLDHSVDYAFKACNEMQAGTVGQFAITVRILSAVNAHLQCPAALQGRVVAHYSTEAIAHRCSRQARPQARRRVCSSIILSRRRLALRQRDITLYGICVVACTANAKCLSRKTQSPAVNGHYQDVIV